MAFLCVVNRRRGVLLGAQLIWPSDAFFEGAVVRCGVDYFVSDDIFVAQVGDGSTTQRNTPVSVSGLSSGVLMLSLGMVSLFVIALQPLLV